MRVLIVKICLRFFSCVNPQKQPQRTQSWKITKASEIVDHSLYPVTKVNDIEVDEESSLLVTKLQISQQLRFKHRMHDFNGLNFDYD